MLRVLICVLAVMALGGCSDGVGTSSEAPQRLAVAPPSLDPEIACAAINAYRARKGLKPLRLNDRLAQAAKAHAQDLAAHDRISHTGSDGSDPWQRIRRTGYRPRVAAENVGTGQASLAEVIKGWQRSPGHNANLLLPDATEMGIAVVYNPDSRYRTFWALVLGASR